MNREPGDDVKGERREPQDRALMESFAISPDRSERRYEQRKHASNAGLLVDDQPQRQRDVCSHEGSKAENQKRGDDEVLAGHAHERSAQSAHMPHLQ